MSLRHPFAGTRKVQEIGGSKAGIIPNEIAEEWELEQGDELYIRETDDGTIEIQPCGSE